MRKTPFLQGRLCGYASRDGQAPGAVVKWLLLACSLVLLIGCGPSSTTKAAYATEASVKGMKVAAQAQKLIEKNDLYGTIRLFEGWAKDLDVLIRKAEKDPNLSPQDREALLSVLRKHGDEVQAGVEAMRLAALSQR